LEAFKIWGDSIIKLRECGLKINFEKIQKIF